MGGKIEKADEKGDIKAIHQGAKMLCGATAQGSRYPTENYETDKEKIKN